MFSRCFVIALLACGCSSSSDDAPVPSTDTGLVVDSATIDSGSATDSAVVAETGDASDAAEDAGCASAVTDGGWTVNALAPQVLADGKVQASMTFARTSGADTRGGGLCLVADLNGGHPCATAADCASLPLPTGGFHYCAGSCSGSPKICWTRPGGPDVYCNRGMGRTPGTYTTPAAPAKVDGKPTTWLTYACMAVEGNPAGCGSADPKDHVTSTSKTVVVP